MKEGILTFSVGKGAKEDESSTERIWGCRISQYNGPFSLGARFENYEPFISLIFQFLSGPRYIADTELVDTGARLYFDYFINCICWSIN
jgi:hypothetical protein